MTYQVKFYPKAEKNLAKLSEKDTVRILKSLLTLESNPYLGKKLRGEYSGYYSIRVWPYRIIYFIKNRECLVIVIRIGQREGVYK